MFLYPGTEDHVLAGTPTGVYESTDGANSWALIAGTEGFGGCRSFRNGTTRLSNFSFGPFLTTPLRLPTPPRRALCGIPDFMPRV